jgi:hypothetical protein
VEKINALCFLSVVTIGELRRGIEIVRHRGDIQQLAVLESWLESVLEEYQDRILDFTEEIAQCWGRLRVPNPENEVDKQIAATAYVHGLAVITRNTNHFMGCGVKIINPFSDNSTEPTNYTKERGQWLDGLTLEEIISDIKAKRDG